MKKLPTKYVLRNYPPQVYKTYDEYVKAKKVCQDQNHDGWLWSVLCKFESRVCDECGTHVVFIYKKK